MYHYRQALVRMRQGESDRQIQATGLMGRRTLGALRKQADERGWLDPARSLPPDHELAAVLQRPKPTLPTHYRASNLTGVWSNSGGRGHRRHHHRRCSQAPPRVHRQLLIGASVSAVSGREKAPSHYSA